MATVSITTSDATPVGIKWEMPTNYEGLRSPIPRGLVFFSGTEAIPTLSAGDVTNYRLNLTLPTGFVYLPKDALINFISDDLVVNFDNNGVLTYQGASGTINNPLTPSRSYNLTSPGVVNFFAALGTKIWVPGVGTPKLFMQGLDVFNMRVADIDAGGSTAGDINYFMNFYVFDVDQIDKWEVNTPIPTISHTSF